MYQGLQGDLFLQAEIDYRHQRAMGELRAKRRPRDARHHLGWPLYRDPSHQRRHHQPVVS
jgi:hypothetical protein